MNPKGQTNYRKSAKKGIEVGEHYRPSKSLINYLNEKLDLTILQHRLTRQGKYLPLNIKHRKANNNRKRINILKTHVFQAMADLVYFFEFIRDNPELQGRFEEEVEEQFKDKDGKMKKKKKIILEIKEAEFEDEIKELLFGVKDNEFNKHKDVFFRFVDAALDWDSNKDSDNFRLKLIDGLQDIIYRNISHISHEDMGDVYAGAIIDADLGRARAITGLYGARVKRDKEDEPSRPVCF